MGRRKYTIKQGKHDSRFFPRPYLGRVKAIEIVYCIKGGHRSPNPDDPQWGSQINKIFGISHGHHHRNSVRIGFKLVDERTYEIMIYEYINGEVKAVPLGVREYGNTYRDSLHLAQYPAPFNYGYILEPYYGGKYSAPVDMEFDVKYDLIRN